MYEELVAALNAADKRPCSDMECPGSGECPTVGCLFRAAADAIEELEASVAGYEASTDVQFVERDGYSELRFVPKWTPVAERLPKNDELKIVAIKDEHGDSPYAYVAVGWYLEKACCWIVDNEWRTDVYSWMPLPLPPEPEVEA